ncbi:MAG: hypothetical protein H0X30_17350 [Anaerolineae bacterium]|nr:hypothetical protein [Anaerolineae bacterium]
MKHQELNTQNEWFRREVHQLLQMDKEDLIENIENDLRSHRTQWDILSDILTPFVQDTIELFQRTPKQKVNEVSNLPYLYLNLGNSISTSYITDIRQALCQNAWLCKKLDSLSQSTLETQIDYINSAIRNLNEFSRYRFRVSSLATAVLITKIGIKEFCGCADPTPSKLS